jgi:hypothetical protein
MKTYPILAALLLLLITGCAEKPTSVGNGLPNIDGSFTILYDTLYAVSDSTYKVSYAPGLGLSNLAGRLSPTEEIVTLINFTPSGAVDSLRGASIDTVELRMTVNYRYFAGMPFQLNIQEVKRSWSQSTFTSDSLPALTLGTTTLGTFSDSMTFAALTQARITDTAAIRRWAVSYYDTSSLVPDFYGFAIRSPLGISNGVVGFSTFNNFSIFVPSLLIKYTRNGRRDSLSVLTGEDTYATVTTGVPSVTPLTMRGAFGIRSAVRFDHRRLLDSTDASNIPIVNRATLELTLDTLNSSFGGYSPDTLTALLGMSATDTDRSDSTIYVYGFRKAVAAGQSPVYAFNITSIADRWVRGVKPNYGLTVRWAAEFGTTEKAVFYSRTNTDAVKRPKLIVTYSKK